MSAMSIDYPSIPLSQFRTNTDEVLHLATVQPVVLISHGGERHVIADSDYFRHLEATASRRLEALMGIKAIAASEMGHADRQTLVESRPTVSEIVNDRWG